MDDIVPLRPENDIRKILQLLKMICQPRFV